MWSLFGSIEPQEQIDIVTFSEFPLRKALCWGGVARILSVLGRFWTILSQPHKTLSKVQDHFPLNHKNHSFCQFYCKYFKGNWRFSKNSFGFGLIFVNKCNAQEKSGDVRQQYFPRYWKNLFNQENQHCPPKSIWWALSMAEAPPLKAINNPWWSCSAHPALWTMQPHNDGPRGLGFSAGLSTSGLVVDDREIQWQCRG